MGPEYVLISERMIQELVERAAGVGFQVDAVQVRPPFTGISASRGDREGNNHLLCEQVTAALFDDTGTVEWPGTYIGARANFKGWMFSIDTGGHSVPVVWMTGEVPETLLVLCGSARNVLAYDAPTARGWRPSSSEGLRQVLAAIRKKDPKTLLGYEASDAKQHEMAVDAAWIDLGLTNGGPPDFREEDVDVLLKPYVYVENLYQRFITQEEVHFERVIVGAPLFIRRGSELPPPGSK